MRTIVERYEGMTTAKGREIRVDRRPGEIVLWSLYRGAHDGVHGRHHMGIARILKQADVYFVGCLRDLEERSYDTFSYWNMDKVFASIDEVIASR